MAALYLPFVVFVLCDKGKLPFPGTAGEKDTKWMYRQLEENYDYTKLQKYVMMISDFAKINKRYFFTNRIMIFKND